MADNKKSSIGGKSTCHLLNVKQPDRASKRIKFTFKRTSATINVLKSDQIVNAAMGFIDISETGAGFFTEELLLKGSTVEVCVMEPRILKMKALVAWSVPLKSGVRGARYSFRSGLQFIFDNEIQRAALLEYIQKVNSDPLEVAKGGAPLPAAAIEVATPAAPGVEGAPVTEEATATETAAVSAAEAAVPTDIAAPVAEAPPVAEAIQAAETSPVAAEGSAEKSEPAVVAEGGEETKAA